ncbi:ATP-grasp domain-containing protein [Geomicrobium sediminis]|uniref:Carbamoylphosphate synthase large subunit n=1 Tax=Geomicrobium sediminis TaxID=1347788 RepID=A0ABS2PC96_9BACL|nr:alpha-L-glutamate ligase [Geomicrobium sediminis]MBM7632731.1 carbamoylphosphate synthase large subunit [Geomicrobium sediminis]
MAKIYVLHENDEWTEPLKTALKALQVPFELWHMADGAFNVLDTPPEGVYYNRMSASSHTRGHRYAPEYTSAVLHWLESHNRIVYNGTQALQFELNKAMQYAHLEKNNIQVPKTYVAMSKEDIIKSAKKMNGPFITKHNRAGKGLGVRLFYSIEGLVEYLDNEFEPSIDGITLIQQYIESKSKTITRSEFIDGKFLYAVEVDTSEGFELCPADACSIAIDSCPTTETPKEKFRILSEFNPSLIQQYEAFLRDARIQFAGIESIQDEDGNTYTYDINTNTNYNSDAEQKVNQFGMQEIARSLKNRLEQEFPQAITGTLTEKSGD